VPCPPRGYQSTNVTPKRVYDRQNDFLQLADRHQPAFPVLPALILPFRDRALEDSRRADQVYAVLEQVGLPLVRVPLEEGNLS